MTIAPDISKGPLTRRPSYSEPLGPSKLRLHDGRVMRWAEWGDPLGRPVLFFHGCPGSWFSFRRHHRVVRNYGLRVITADRPGFGESTRLFPYSLDTISGDFAALLDHRNLERVDLLASSGGAPFLLKFAERYPGRSRVATVMGGMAPVRYGQRCGATELDDLISQNQITHSFVHDNNWAGLRQFFADERATLFQNSEDAYRRMMAATNGSDQRLMADSDWIALAAANQREALAPGIEGWYDETIATWAQSWRLDRSRIQSSITWWHGAHDKCTPLTAARRLVDSLPTASINVLPDIEHLLNEWFPLIAKELIARSEREPSGVKRAELPVRVLARDCRA